MKYQYAALALIACSLILCGSVYADLGPKPKAAFQLSEGMEVTCPFDMGMDTTECKLFQCSDETCTDASPLQRYGPQAFYCRIDSCHALAYNFAPYGKLQLQLEGGVVQSNVFAMNDGLGQKYAVTLSNGELRVSETAGSRVRHAVAWIAPFLIALVLTLALEIGFVSVLIWRNWFPREARRTLFVANLITLPIAWVVVMLGHYSFAAWVIAEISVVVAEALILHFQHRNTISIWKAGWVSIVANVLSLFVGGFVVVFFLIFIRV